jgi:hypothetical protein
VKEEKVDLGKLLDELEASDGGLGLTDEEQLLAEIEHELILQTEVYPTAPPRLMEDWESYVEYLSDPRKERWALSEETRKRWGV